VPGTLKIGSQVAVWTCVKSKAFGCSPQKGGYSNHVTLRRLINVEGRIEYGGKQITDFDIIWSVRL